MSHSEDQLIFVLQQGRLRSIDWDHPWTQRESDLQSLIFDNLFGDGSADELSALTAALQDQRKTDNRWFHSDRDEFDRQRAIYFTTTKTRFDNMRTKKNEQ